MNYILCWKRNHFKMDTTRLLMRRLEQLKSFVIQADEDTNGSGGPPQR